MRIDFNFAKNSIMALRIVFIALIFPFVLQAQIKKQEVVAFYNLENLFDTINQEQVNDGEYTPSGSKQWSAERYQNKLQNMAKVLYQVGDTNTKKGFAFVGVCEVENRSVLEDLIQTAPLNKRKLEIVHEDSPDKRGIDVAMLYNPKKFQVLDYKYINPRVFDEQGDLVFTRNILLVKGVLKKTDTLFVLVNHWPSRYGGEEKSMPRRALAAQRNREIIDSVLAHTSEKSRIIVMGDLNDDPNNESVEAILQTSPEIIDGDFITLYNPYYNIFMSNTGTLKYRGNWNLFDQIIISNSNMTTGSYRFQSAEIFNPPYLFQKSGEYEGYPLRTYGGKTYLNGYSDHLPVYLILKKQ